MIGAFDLGSGLLEWERPWEGKYLGVVEGGSGMEGSSGRRMTSGRSDVAEDDFGKVGCGGGSRLDSGSCRLLEKSSR